MVIQLAVFIKFTSNIFYDDCKRSPAQKDTSRVLEKSLEYSPKLLAFYTLTKSSPTGIPSPGCLSSLAPPTSRLPPCLSPASCFRFSSRSCHAGFTTNPPRSSRGGSYSPINRSMQSRREAIPHTRDKRHNNPKTQPAASSPLCASALKCTIAAPAPPSPSRPRHRISS